jgi:hypothetical protein
MREICEPQENQTSALMVSGVGEKAHILPMPRKRPTRPPGLAMASLLAFGISHD